MTDGELVRLQKRGRAADLHDEIGRLSREFVNLMRPLRDRCNEVLPRDEYPRDVARVFDVVAARQELDSIARVSELLEGAIAEYQGLADELGIARLKR